MDFAFKTRNCAFKMMDFALKTRNCAFKMIGFAGRRHVVGLVQAFNKRVPKRVRHEDSKKIDELAFHPGSDFALKDR